MLLTLFEFGFKNENYRLTNKIQTLYNLVSYLKIKNNFITDNLLSYSFKGLFCIKSCMFVACTYSYRVILYNIILFLSI